MVNDRYLQPIVLDWWCKITRQMFLAEVCALQERSHQVHAWLPISAQCAKKGLSNVYTQHFRPWSLSEVFIKIAKSQQSLKDNLQKLHRFCESIMCNRYQTNQASSVGKDLVILPERNELADGFGQVFFNCRFRIPVLRVLQSLRIFAEKLFSSSAYRSVIGWVL